MLDELDNLRKDKIFLEKEVEILKAKLKQKYEEQNINSREIPNENVDNLQGSSNEPNSPQVELNTEQVEAQLLKSSVNTLQKSSLGNKETLV